MTQATRRSRFAFVPTPIEQQLAVHQLGQLLDVYQWGWIRSAQGDRHPSKLRPLIIALVGVIGTIASIILIIDAILTTGLIVIGIYFIPLATIIIAAIGMRALFQGSFCVAVFSEGFVYARGTRITVLRWHEIVSCEYTTTKTRTHGMVREYALRTHSGTLLKWRASAQVIQNVGRIIDEHIA
ncbi:MAG TPA: DUF6585 family protein [Ktedonobacteraceae bacterium]